MSWRDETNPKSWPTPVNVATTPRHAVAVIGRSADGVSRLVPGALGLVAELNQADRRALWAGLQHDQPALAESLRDWPCQAIRAVFGTGVAPVLPVADMRRLIEIGHAATP